MFPVGSYTTRPGGGEVTELACYLVDGTDVSAPKNLKAFIQRVAEHSSGGTPVRFGSTRRASSTGCSKATTHSQQCRTIRPETFRGALVEVGFWALMKRAYADAVRENTERTERALAESATDARPADPGTPRGHERTAGREKSACVSRACGSRISQWTTRTRGLRASKRVGTSPLGAHREIT